MGFGTWALDRSDVTIAHSTRSVAATGVLTQAEREGGGFEYLAGWQPRAGWNWRRPDGTPSANEQLAAVHLTHAGAAAY